MGAVAGSCAQGRGTGCVLHADEEGMVTVAFYRIQEPRAYLTEVRAFRSGSFEISTEAAHRLLVSWVPPEGAQELNATQARSGPLGHMMSEMLAWVEDVNVAARDRIPLLSREQVDLIVANADPTSFGFRNARDLRAHLMYAATAGLYVHERAGMVSDLPAELHESPAKVAALVARARRHGYLSSVGGGRKGGIVTDKWFSLVEAIQEWLKSACTTQVGPAGGPTQYASGVEVCVWCTNTFVQDGEQTECPNCGHVLG